MILTAIVIKTFRRSCEVLVVAQAESVDGQRRITNDALFTLALDDAEGQGESHIVSKVEMPPGSALETFANVSEARRIGRLELKALLARIYS